MPAEHGEVLLDTHVLLWWKARSPRMSIAALGTIAAAKRRLVSPITCWEVAMLVVKGRVQLDRPTAVWVRDIVAEGDIETASLSPSIAVAAAELPDFHGDPADRLLYATARSRQALLLTKDQRLHRYAIQRGDVSVDW